MLQLPRQESLGRRVALVWRKILFCLILCAGIALVAYVVVSYFSDFRETAGAFRQLSTGMPEQKVRALLGKPYREYTADEAVHGYHIEGWTHDSRKVTGKVLIYLQGDVICYVYIDPNQEVEHVFIGGS
jgi:hypothetical protein